MNHGECWGRAFELPNSPCQGSEGGDTHAKKAGVARNRVGTAARVQPQVAEGQAGHFKDFSFYSEQNRGLSSIQSCEVT